MAVHHSWEQKKNSFFILHTFKIIFVCLFFSILLFSNCHMLACSLFSYIAINWFKLAPLQTRLQFHKISALSLIFCLSVVADNVSLRYLPVSFAYWQRVQIQRNSSAFFNCGIGFFNGSNLSTFQLIVFLFLVFQS